MWTWKYLGRAAVVAVVVPVSIGIGLTRSQADDPAAVAPAATLLGGDRGARTEWLARHIEERIASSRRLADARIGVAVRDTLTGEILYQRGARERYNVASNVKIVTAAAALSLLGPDYQYQTGLFADVVDPGGVIAGNLYFRGAGDPSLGTADLLAMVDDLVVAGITRIRGDIVVDDSLFDAENLPPHFDEQPDEQASFRAPVGAVSLNFNAYAVVVRPSRTGSGYATITIDPAGEYVDLKVARVRTVRSGRSWVRIDSAPAKGRLEVKVTGQVRAGSSVLRYRRRVEDPVQYVGHALRAALRARGIRVDGKEVVRAEVPDGAARLVVRWSPPVAELVRALGKFSNNFVAEMLLKTIGAEMREDDEPATWADGQNAVREFLTGEMGLTPDSFRYDNGSGLFQSNELSPLQLTQILAAAHGDFRYSSDLMSSLSIAGADGTLSRRMDETDADRRVRAKTGTLATVSALSGYAAIDGRHPLVFSVIVNDIPESSVATREARDLQDSIAEALLVYLRGDL